jgi:pimeloyl-ACP methyl ester carboxylesterase
MAAALPFSVASGASTVSRNSARVAAGANIARLSDGDTAYYLAGDQGQWVVLVHGVLPLGYTWAPLAKTLAEQGFRVLYYDGFGRGLSDCPAVDYDLDLHVRQLQELIDKLEIDVTHMIGWSLGGTIATRFAAEHPTRVGSLTLIAPALGMPRWLQILAGTPGVNRLMALIACNVDRLEKALLSRPERHPDFAARAREQLAFSGVRKSVTSCFVHFPRTSGDQWKAVGQHRRAVLIIWGNRDRVNPYAWAPHVLGLYPRATLLTVEDARHAPHLDQTDVVHSAIINHLKAA